MDDADFSAQSPRDRNYFAWFLSRLRPGWYFSKGLSGAGPGMKPVVAIVLAFLYPLWVLIVALGVVAYCALWVLLLPLRVWARKNKKGYFAAASSDEPG